MAGRALCSRIATSPMYNLAKLLDDVAQKRGRLLAKDGPTSGPPEYAEVWSAFTSYIKACMAEKRGLHMPLFCKIGWRVDRRSKGSASVRPFFQLTDQFCRAYLSAEAVKKHQQQMVPEKDVCQLEEFNFSKAAIKYSQQLTKDQVFTGLRAIIQRLGELVAEGKDGEILLGEVGRLRCGGAGGREPTFQFSGEVYAMEGQHPPNIPAAPKEETPAAFSKDMPREAMGLGIRGTNAVASSGDLGFTVGVDTIKAEPLPKIYEEVLPPVSPDPYYEDQEVPPPRLATSASAPQLSVGQPSTTELKQGFAYKEAMERHVKALEQRAQEAVAEHDAWNQHVVDCLEQEREEILSKRFRAKDNLQFLQGQMAQTENRKRSQRKEDIEAASAHEFPIMQAQAKEESKKQFLSGMQQRLRADLDAQVRTNNTLRNLAKQRERALEIDHLESLRTEMTHLRGAERAKKAYEREALSSAWNSDVRLHNIMKAIDSHGKSGSAAARGATPQVLVTDALPSGRGTPMGSAGRIMTGSQRRLPLGASGSLGQLEARLQTAGSRRY